MTSKFRKFLDLINEQLDLNDEADNFVSFAEVDFRKEGLSISDVERFKDFLIRKGIMSRLTEWRGNPDNPLPSKHETKLRTFSWWWPFLGGNRENTMRKYVFELTSRENFLKFYRQSSSEEEITGGFAEDRFSKLRVKISEIESLKHTTPWGGEYKVWNGIVEKEVEKNFGRGGLGLFRQQRSVAIDDEAYRHELTEKGKILEKLILNSDDYKPEIPLVMRQGSYQKFPIKDEIPDHKNDPGASPVFNVKDSQFHFGSGDNVGRDKNKNPQSGLLEKYWWGLLIPIFVGLIVPFIRSGEVSRLFNIPPASPSQSKISSTTDAINVWDILSQTDSFSTSLELQNFLEKYKNSNVYGVGSFNDINKVSENYYLFMYSGKYPIACSFEDVDSSTERELLLLKNGNSISFVGTFMGGQLNGAAWYISGCSLSR